jgi:hypothetical protein
MRVSGRAATPAEQPAPGSAERQRKPLDARTEKLDLELSISERPRLSDQLIQPLFGNRAVTMPVNVE